MSGHSQPRLVAGCCMHAFHCNSSPRRNFSLYGSAVARSAARSELLPPEAAAQNAQPAVRTCSHTHTLDCCTHANAEGLPPMVAARTVYAAAGYGTVHKKCSQTYARLPILPAPMENCPKTHVWYAPHKTVRRRHPILLGQHLLIQVDCTRAEARPGRAAAGAAHRRLHAHGAAMENG